MIIKKGFIDKNMQIGSNNEEYKDNTQPKHRWTEKKRCQSSIYEYFN
jgi:hypothetical protein